MNILLNTLGDPTWQVLALVISLAAPVLIVVVRTRDMHASEQQKRQDTLTMLFIKMPEDPASYDEVSNNRGLLVRFVRNRPKYQITTIETMKQASKITKSHFCLPSSLSPIKDMRERSCSPNRYAGRMIFTLNRLAKTSDQCKT